MGKETVQKYEKRAETPHGRLRHDLLYMYYDLFMNNKKIDWMFDIGAGSGFLVKRLVKRYPKLKVVIVDPDEVMINRARKNLLTNIKLIKGTIEDFPAIFKSFKIIGTSITAFNHAIEYVENKGRAIRIIKDTIPSSSYFGIMYLNNSHEAVRKLIFNDSIDK